MKWTARRRVVKYLQCDLDDSLAPCAIHYNRLTLKCARMVMEALGPYCPHPEDVIAYQHAWDVAAAKRHGRVNPQRFAWSWSATYRHFSRQLGRPIDSRWLRRLASTADQVRSYPCRTFPGVKRALRRLQEMDFVLFMITTGPRRRQLEKVEQAGLRPFFGPRVYPTVHDKGATLDQLFNGRGRETAVIGDSLSSDIAPALARGMIAIWVKYQAWGLAKSDVRPDFTIRSFTEAPDLLEPFRP